MAHANSHDEPIAATVDKSSTYIFDSFAIEPVFHRYGKIDRDKDADVTACGLVMWTIEGGTEYAAGLPRFHAERFARPCGRCYPDA